MKTSGDLNDAEKLFKMPMLAQELELNDFDAEFFSPVGEMGADNKVKLKDSVQTQAKASGVDEAIIKRVVGLSKEGIAKTFGSDSDKASKQLEIEMKINLDQLHALQQVTNIDAAKQSAKKEFDQAAQIQLFE